mmetsp:Transcript_66440/g.155779  ORF Transcript_66440/g.155779 Transcript_66440/m.155779 type:complete len:610 (+) Transcript_66440:90-1919(+)
MQLRGSLKQEKENLDKSFASLVRDVRNLHERVQSLCAEAVPPDPVPHARPHLEELRETANSRSMMSIKPRETPLPGEAIQEVSIPSLDGMVVEDLDIPTIPDRSVDSREFVRPRALRAGRGMSDSDMGPRPSLSDVRQKSFSESNCLAAAKMTMLKENPWCKESGIKWSAWTELAVSPRSSKEAPESPIEKLVASFTFKAVCMVAIIANTMYLGVNADWKIRNAFGPIDGRQREVEDTAWDITFAVWFSIEILLRLLAEKISFFTGEEQAWNLFDSFLVVESIVGLLFPVGAKLSFLRIIRVFRLARVVKLVKAVKALRRLRTMIFSIANSFIDLMWAFLVVILILFIFGIILSNSAATYFESINLGSSDDIDEAVNVIKPLFGSLPVTMLSLWCAISGGNDWMVYAEALMVMDRDNSYVYVAVFLFYTAFCVVGLFNVVTGVFVDSAVCCRTEDEVLQSYMDDLKHTTAEIKKFFETADSDGSGTLSYREFCGHLRNPTVKAFFHGLDIDPEEASIIFRILDDDKNDEILIEEFINGTMKLKGHATKLEMITLMYDNTRQSMKLDSLCEFLEQEFQELRRVSRPCSGQGLPQGAWPASSLKTNQSGTT